MALPKKMAPSQKVQTLFTVHQQGQDEWTLGDTIRTRLSRAQPLTSIVLGRDLQEQLGRHHPHP